jgi:hypothetical protein
MTEKDGISTAKFVLYIHKHKPLHPKYWELFQSVGYEEKGLPVSRKEKLETCEKSLIKTI